MVISQLVTLRFAMSKKAANNNDLEKQSRRNGPSAGYFSSFSC